MGEDDAPLRKRLEELRLEYGARIHDVFEQEEFQRVEDVVDELREEGVSRSAVAGLHRVYAYLANERVPLEDIAQEYDLTQRSVQNGMRQITERAGIDIDTRGAPEKIRERAVREAQDLFDTGMMAKTPAAERIAERYRVSADWVREQLQGESTSKYAEKGLTERVGRLLSRRPQTNKELVDRLDLPQTANKYTRYLDVDKRATAGHRRYIWYQPGQKSAAEAYDAVLQAVNDTDREDWYDATIESLAANTDQDLLGMAPGNWWQERTGMDTAIRDTYAENPQYVAALQHRIPGIADFLVDDHDTNRFRAADVAAYLGADGDHETREYGKALALLEDDAGILSSYGTPRLYSTDTYSDVDVFLAAALVDRLE